MRTIGSTLDGRWLAVVLLLVYYVILGVTGPAGELPERWRRAGVYAHPLPFLDLWIFPEVHATVQRGGDLYGPIAMDPLKRSYNYPRVWLTFMRFPASDGWFRGIGCALAAVAVATVLLFWGRLSPMEGLFGGLLLCCPAFQLAVERGNTDLAMLVLVAVGVWLGSDARWRRLASAVWWVAATLKLYPVLAFGGWFDGSARAWLRRTWLPLGLFALYLVVIRHDLGPILSHTGGGWVQSYGTEVLATALEQVRAFYGTKWAENFPVAGACRLVAVAGVGGMLFLGWRRNPGTQMPEQEMPVAARRAQLGFRIGALVYLGTFIAGASFDYRQCFLLLTLPQLLAWQHGGSRLAMIALAALAFSLGLNYLIAGWSGFLLNEIAGWLLLFVLAALLGGTWRWMAREKS